MAQPRASVAAWVLAACLCGPTSGEGPGPRAPGPPSPAAAAQLAEDGLPDRPAAGALYMTAGGTPFDRVAEEIAVLGHCSGAAKLDFTRAQVTQNNLGGRGPDSGEQVIRYAKVGTTANGTHFDIVVSNTSAYTMDANGANQGLALGGRMGELNVAAASRTDLRLSFVNSSSGKPLQLDNVILTFIALGSVRPQVVAACGSSAYYLSEGLADVGPGAKLETVPSEVEVLADRPGPFCTTFESVPRVLEDVAADVLHNLYDPVVLSPEQRAKSLSLQYNRGVTYVDISLAVGGRPATGSEPHQLIGPSSFLFAGSTPIDGCADVGTTTTTITVTTTTVTRTLTTTLTTTVTTTTLPPLYTCEGEADQWTTEKQIWCCEREGKACNLGNPQTQTDAEAHNCYSGYAHWQQQWSSEKKAWCCERHEMGCEPTYDCAGGRATEAPPGWSAARQAWCCAHDDSLGCRDPEAGVAVPTLAPRSAKPTTPFDCSAGLAAWEDGWSPAKKAWCWQHEQKGSGTPFVCQSGVASWEADWSGEKKAYCCVNEKLGCGFDCTYGDRSEWPAVKRSWCCTMRGDSRACANESLPASRELLQQEGPRQLASASALAMIVGGAAFALVLGAAAVMVRRSQQQQLQRYRMVSPLAFLDGQRPAPHPPAAPRPPPGAVARDVCAPRPQ